MGENPADGTDASVFRFWTTSAPFLEGFQSLLDKLSEFGPRHKLVICVPKAPAAGAWVVLLDTQK